MIMDKILNFSKSVVTGVNKAEAIAKAPFEVVGDATQAYLKWKGSVEDESGLKDFLVEYLAKKTKNEEGKGFIITLTPAITNTRKSPYSIKDIKNDKGIRKYKTTYQLIDTTTGVVVAETAENKNTALQLGRKLYKETGFTHNIKCVLVKKVIEGSDTLFEMVYNPSKGTQAGEYIVFGITKD
jgi:hypothetical protein